MKSGYVAVRSDAGLRSLSSNERSFVRSSALALDSPRVLRVDGRLPGEVRKIQLHLTRSGSNGAVCTVQWGETRVSAEIQAALQVPSQDRPSEGVVSITVDTSPIASTTFGMMPAATTTPATSEDRYFASTADETQKLLTNRILRCLERTILVGGALDTEALCVQSGAWVWRLSLSVRILDHGGNLMDASVLASMAALRHYRKPQVELVTGGMPLLVHADAREPTPLPLHHTPLTISFALVHADDVALSSSTVAALVDPTEREELVQTGSISIAMNVHSEVCLLDFGGGCEIQPKQLQQCWKLAEKCILQLCEMLENCLKEADEKAQNERLHRLQKLQQQPNLPPLLPPNEPPQVPFWQEQDDGDLVDTTMMGSTLSEEIQQAADQVQDQVEETYRLQALEYNQGHVAAKVKDWRKTSKKQEQKQHEGGALLTALLRSAKPQPREEATTPADTMETSSLGPSTEQMEEFQQVAAKAAAGSKTSISAPPTTKPEAMDLDDDDEEAPMMLKSEFDSVKKEQSTPAQKEGAASINDNDDIDDLAMAIKSKTKKKKKPKKSK